MPKRRGYTWYGRSAVDRFMAKVQPEATTGCWLWTGTVDGKGYGMFQYQGRSHRAPRLALLFLRGIVVPLSLTVDHVVCQRPACVNPDHLEVVTRSENTRRARALRPLKTHCPRGHELIEANTRIQRTTDGMHRHCRECERRR